MSLALLALAVLGVGVLWSIVAGARQRVALGGALAAAAVGGILATVAAGTVLCGASIGPAEIVWPLPLGAVSLGLDGLSAFFLLVIGLTTIAASIYSWGYFRDEPPTRSLIGYGVFYCLLVAALITVVAARDGVLFLMAWELMGVSSFFLVTFRDRDPEARRGAWMYLISTHIGGAVGIFPLFGILVIRGGGTSFAAMSAAAAGLPMPWAVGCFVMALIGFGTKAGFMPMHNWLPAAHPVAPSPVSALMSGVLLKMGIYGLLRSLGWLPPLPIGCALALMGVGIITGSMGILYAVGQKQLKRMLAYSSVENMGIVALGIGVALLGRSLDRPLIVQLGLAGALLHVLNHSLFKGLLFLSAGSVLHSTGTQEFDRLGGLAKKTPRNAALFLLGAMGICALPPLNGFVSEWLIYSALFHTAMGPFSLSAGSAVVGLLALAFIGGVALTGFSKVFAITFLGAPRDATIHAHRTSTPMLLGMLVPAVLCVIIGTCPWLVIPLLNAPMAALGFVSVDSSLADAFAPLVLISRGALILAGVVAALALLRKCAGTDQPITAGPTWGCGYSAPTARMQYTGSSFGWSILRSFRRILLPRRQAHLPAGCFPATGDLSTSVPDVMLTKGYAPAFGWSGRFAEACRPMERWRIHVLLMGIVVTLVVMFAVETVFRPFWPAERSSAGAAPVHSAVVDGGAPRAGGLP